MKQSELDQLLDQSIERHYRRLVNVYRKRLEQARDKEFAYAQFVSRMLVFEQLRADTNGEYPLQIEILEKGYKLGKPVAQSIRELRQTHKNIDFNKEYELEAFDDTTANEVALSVEKRITRFSNVGNLSDEEVVRLFAQYMAYRQFSAFLEEEMLQFTTGDKKPESLTALLEDMAGKNREYTTSRQVLAINYLLKYYQVKNVDMTEKARFIHFLTGKNYDNIYKRVQNPLNGKDKYVVEDLKYIRGYFERLELKEIVKMVDNELSVHE